MNTPICSFLDKYASDDNLRLHMPGHKGIGGEIQARDLTEISGADSLYEASGIIKESEENASRLFGSYTLYSTEGSSLAIRAMLYLALLEGRDCVKPVVLAARNAHKVFVSAAALIDFEIEWIMGSSDSYLCANPTYGEIARAIDSMETKPVAVYITSPDYLGNTANIAEISRVCHERGVLLLVDNAHGAYLAFTTPSQHPIALGADMCADSAHKTLPCLTGAAYLHLSDTISVGVRARAKTALSLFGSTSPSYLILESLDKANAYLANDYKEKLEHFAGKLECLKARLMASGYEIIGNEPMKLTIATRSYGYTGYELADALVAKKIVPEFADPDYLVLMPTPEISSEELERLENVLISLEKRERILTSAPNLSLPVRRLSPREAVLSDAERISVSDAVGRVLADITVGCPPAVPIVVSGEEINEDMVRVFEYYGIDTCSVIK